MVVGFSEGLQTLFAVQIIIPLGADVSSYGQLGVGAQTTEAILGIKKQSIFRGSTSAASTSTSAMN